MGKNSTSHIKAKSAQGYSPKYTEHVFSVTELNFPLKGRDKKIATKLQIATVKFSDLSQFVAVAIRGGSKHNSAN